MPEPVETRKQAGMPPGTYRLLACCLLIGVIWLAVFPRLSDLPQVRARAQLLESKGIDPAAMFYTELEAASRALERADEFQRQHPTALWTIDDAPQ